MKKVIYLLTGLAFGVLTNAQAAQHPELNDYKAKVTGSTMTAQNVAKAAASTLAGDFPHTPVNIQVINLTHYNIAITSPVYQPINGISNIYDSYPTYHVDSTFYIGSITAPTPHDYTTVTVPGFFSGTVCSKAFIVILENLPAYVTNCP